MSELMSAHGRRRTRESASHRRARKQRQIDRIMLRLDAARSRLERHHGSAPPKAPPEAPPDNVAVSGQAASAPDLERLLGYQGRQLASLNQQYEQMALTMRLMYDAQYLLLQGMNQAAYAPTASEPTQMPSAASQGPKTASGAHGASSVPRTPSSQVSAPGSSMSEVPTTAQSLLTFSSGSAIGSGSAAVSAASASTQRSPTTLAAPQMPFSASAAIQTAARVPGSPRTPSVPSTEVPATGSSSSDALTAAQCFSSFSSSSVRGSGSATVSSSSASQQRPSTIPAAEQRSMLASAATKTSPTTSLEFVWNIHTTLVEAPRPLLVDDFRAAYRDALGHDCAIDQFLVCKDGVLGALKRIPHVVTILHMSDKVFVEATQEDDVSFDDFRLVDEEYRSKLVRI